MEANVSERLAELDSVHQDPPGYLFPRVGPPSNTSVINSPASLVARIAPDMRSLSPAASMARLAGLVSEFGAGSPPRAGEG